MKAVGYINKRLSSDVQSWRVYKDEDGRHFAVSVERKPSKEWIQAHNAAGDDGHYIITDGSYYDDTVVPVVENGELFEITERKGVWGYLAPETYGCFSVAGVDMDKLIKDAAERGVARIQISKDGELFTYVALTPKGKDKKHFEKLGVIDKKCNYFFDYNF